MGKAFITPESLERYYWSSDVHIHPMGEKLAYVRKEINKEQDRYYTSIRMVQLDGAADTSLTTGTRDSMPIWSPNGEQLAFLRVTEGINQLWLIDANGKAERQLTEAKRSISKAQWLPDGSGLIYVMSVHLDEQQEAMPESVIQQHRNRQGASYTAHIPKAEGSGWWDGMYSHIFHYELQTGRTRQLTAGAFHADQPRMRGNTLSFIAKSVKGDALAGDEPVQGLYVLDDILDEKCALKRLISEKYEVQHYSWSADGALLTFIGHDRTYGSATHNKLYQVDVYNGTAINQISNEDIQLGVYVLNDMTSGASVPGPISIDEEDYGASIYGLASQHGEVQLWKWQQGKQGQRLTHKSWVIHQLYASAQGDVFVVNAIDSHGPAELYAIERSSGMITQLTSWNDAFCQQHSIAAPQSISFVNDEGDEVQGWLLTPPEPHDDVLESELVDAGLIPLVVVIHGGPHAMYSPVFSHEFQSVVAQGFALLFCNPRGSFGYGQAFARGCLKDFGNGDYRDIMQAVDRVLEQYPKLDAQRLGVMGGSYGGLMTNWIIGQSNRFAAAISQRSISNWLSFYGTSDIGARYTEAMVGAHPWEDQALLWERSPLAYVKEVQTPVLIMHGEQDFRCPIEQSDQWYANLKRWGKEAKLVRYAGSNHAFQKAGKPSLRIDVLEQVNGWLRKYLFKPVMLGIPFVMLLENLRSSGKSDEVIARCIAEKDFASIAHLVKEPDMPFLERAELAEELGINWQQVFQYGYCFSFLHANALKRLLYFRYDLVEGQHYSEQQYELHDVQLTEEQAQQLHALIERQWQMQQAADGYAISRKVVMQ